MDALLEKIVLNTENKTRNTEPKESFSILLSERSSQMRTKFNPLIQLDKSKRYEMALVNLETHNSFPNIDSSNNNSRYSPDKGTTWFNINVREGSYEIVDIYKYVRRIMKENGHYAAAAGDGDAGGEIYPISIQPNRNTLKSVLDIDANYKVDFATANTIRTV